ncbi:hypothetical protein M404DRAFT_30648 [Pisolithus tinctorius Marx 270]|uniref:Uncharacterized protein n=1 Tax=Pisolithus tinctorius Marx 270 TaxID=870435 RepID=A0A0C3JP05_PISTI|nr:hypothetical protein M404DRAFT_30648 [Pisolithus tinctorius Marx 270]
MVHKSARQETLEILGDAAVRVAEMQLQQLGTYMEADNNDSDSSMSDGDWTDVLSEPLSPMILSPISSMSTSSSLSLSSLHSVKRITAPYTAALQTIRALYDEVHMARVFERPGIPMMHASQLPLLDHFAIHRPLLFQKKLRVDPVIFDDILDQISDHYIFLNKLNNKQLPVAVQLAIFLFCVGHYSNASSPEDAAQWAGVSVRTVINCTHWVMAALLDKHDNFIYVPDVRSPELRCA